jgi:hypothetical protein
MDVGWEEVARYGRLNSTRNTLFKYSSFFSTHKNPHRKLKSIIQALNANLTGVSKKLPYGTHIDTLLKHKVMLYMSEHDNRIDDVRIRILIVDLLTVNDQLYLLKENGGKLTFSHQWILRALDRWKICPREKLFKKKLSKVERKKLLLSQQPVELSIAECKAMQRDTSKIIRRKATDPLPCVGRRQFVKKMRYEDEDEEDCWVNTLKGGYEEYERLTLDDRLMLPCSIRSKIFIISVDIFGF